MAFKATEPSMKIKNKGRRKSISFVGPHLYGVNKVKGAAGDTGGAYTGYRNGSLDGHLA